MTGMKRGFSAFAQELLKEFTNLSDKFADAVKDGANQSSEKILSAVDEFAEPSTVLLEKLSTAVRNADHEQISEAVDGLIHPSSILFFKITDSLKENAVSVGEKMMTALEESVQPAPIDTKKWSEAVKDGTSFASEKMIKAVEDFGQMIKTFKARKS